MTYLSKTLAFTAAVATTIIFTQSPADARRHKHKAARAQVAATAPAPSGILGAGNQYPHLANRAVAARSRADRGVRQTRQARPAYRGRHARTARVATPRLSPAARSAHAAVMPSGMVGSSSLVATARRYMGTNPTGMSALWCARFMNMVLQKTGRRGTGSNMARSFASYGRRVAGPQVGAIAVMSRGRGGGHVGVVSGIDKSGNPIIISGNYNRRVSEAVFPRGRIYAYVMP